MGVLAKTYKKNQNQKIALFCKKIKKIKNIPRQLMALECVGFPPAPRIKNPSMEYMIPPPFIGTPG